MEIEIIFLTKTLTFHLYFAYILLTLPGSGTKQPESYGNHIKIQRYSTFCFRLRLRNDDARQGIHINRKTVSQRTQNLVEVSRMDPLRGTGWRGIPFSIDMKGLRPNRIHTPWIASGFAFAMTMRIYVINNDTLFRLWKKTGHTVLQSGWRARNLSGAVR